MIIDFSFGNFRSFKEIQTLNMTAAKINELPENTIKIDEKLSLLKSKAIYGANASGKSNIVKAFVTFLKIIRDSVKNDEVLNLVENFKFSEETENKPTFFQLIFLVDEIQYRYGFETTNKVITSEWLFGKPNKREVPFFIRENDEIIEISEKHFREGKKLLDFFGENTDDNEIFRKNALFLSSVAAMNGKLSKSLINEKFTSIQVLSGLKDKLMFTVSSIALQNKNLKNKILEFLNFGDTGINSLEIVELEDNKTELFSKHNKYNSDKEKINEILLPFLKTQSEGTIKMFGLSVFIINAIENGETIIIDEFDARFHPLITKKIVELFNSLDNPKAQLIFITHDTNLLSNELVRRDQIDFVEKDNQSESHLYSLAEIKGVRNNASFEKDYIQGKYGAVPFVGNFAKILNK